MCAIHGALFLLFFFALDLLLPRWVLSAVKILDRLSWLDAGRLKQFIFNCQDGEIALPEEYKCGRFVTGFS